MLNPHVGEDVIAGLHQTYTAVAKRHLHPWWLWVLFSMTIGFSVGVFYVANQQMQFDASHAQVVSGLTVSLSQPLPKGTIINAIKFDPVSNKPAQNWVFDDRYYSKEVLDDSLSITLSQQSLPSGHSYDSDYFFTSNAPQGIEVELPSGVVYVSGPASNGAVSFSFNTPIGNLKKNHSVYKLSASFINEKGVKKPLKFTADDIDYVWIDDYQAKIVNGDIVLKVPGPLPIIGELTITAGPDPDDPDFDLYFYDRVYLPNLGSGNYEIVFRNLAAIPEDQPVICPSYASPDGCWNVREVIFTPEKGGKPFSASSVRPPQPPKIQLGPNDILVQSPKPLPAGTKLVAVWASKKRPTKLWFVDYAYQNPTLFAPVNQFINAPVAGERPYTATEAQELLGEPAMPAVIALLPSGDVAMSGKVVKQIAKLSASRIIVNAQKSSATYKLKIVFQDSQGNKIPLPDAEIYVASDDGNTMREIEVINNTVVNPGPLPLQFEVAATDPDSYEWISGSGYLPAYTSGVVEFVMYDSTAAFERQHAHDNPAQYNNAWDNFVSNDVRKAIFTPNRGGSAQESNPSDLGAAAPGQGSAVTITTLPITPVDAKTKFGTKIAEMAITNTAANLFPGTKTGPVYIRQIGLRLVVDGASQAFRPNTRLMMGTGSQASFSKKPIPCDWGLLDNQGCFVAYFFNKKIAPGATEHISIIADLSSLPSGATVTPKLGDQVDLRYRYVAPPKKKGGKNTFIDYILTPAQTPVLFPAVIK